jgi:hypothetical protein
MEIAYFQQLLQKDVQFEMRGQANAILVYGIRQE